MIRNMVFLTRKPPLRKMWVKTVVDYIREHYGNPPQVDAIVGPDTNGYVLDLSVASKLHLPYIPICKVGEVTADPDDLIQRTYINRKNEVNFFFEINRLIVAFVQRNT